MRLFVGLAAAALGVFAVLAGFVVDRPDPLTRLDGPGRATGCTARCRPSTGCSSRPARSPDWGNPIVVNAVLLVVLGLTIQRAGLRAGLLVVLARVVELLAQSWIKNGVARMRPNPGDPVAHAGGFGFPSGHAAGTALWTVLLAASLTGLLPSSRHRLAWSVAVAVTATVAASRVLLGVHYLSDVVAGAGLGAGVAFASLAAIGPRRPARSRR